MTSADYLKIARRHRLLLILLPLLAALVVAAGALSRPPVYTATATVAATAVAGGTSTNQYSGSTGPKTFVADFQAALTSPQVLGQVSQQTGVKHDVIVSGLSSAPIGTSTLIEVTYEAKKRSRAAPVALAAARATITFLFSPQRDLASQPVDDAQKALDDANTALTSFLATSSSPVPDRDYGVLATAIANLEQERTKSAANGDTTIATRLDADIASQRQQLVKLGALVSQFNALQARRDQAVTQLTAARQTLRQAEAQFEAANPDRVVRVGPPAKPSPVPGALRSAIAAAAAALFFAVAIVALIELRRHPRAVAEEAGPTVGKPADKAAETAPVKTAETAADKPADKPAAPGPTALGAPSTS